MQNKHFLKLNFGYMIIPTKKLILIKQNESQEVQFRQLVKDITDVTF